MCMAGGCNMQVPTSTTDTAKHFLSLEPVYECLRASIFQTGTSSILAYKEKLVKLK